AGHFRDRSLLPRRQRGDARGGGRSAAVLRVTVGAGQGGSRRVPGDAMSYSWFLNRSAIRRLLGRLGVAALPTLGWSCGRAPQASDVDLAALPDLAVVSPADLAFAEQPDLLCRLPLSFCQWFVYVDAGADAGNIGAVYGWPPDGGVDPCAP